MDAASDNYTAGAPTRAGANEAFLDVVGKIWNFGDPVTTHRGPTREMIAFQFEIEQPQARLVTLESRGLSVTTAVARFVWMVAGNDRLDDIAYYEPKVRAFTDDGLIVPGSSYGRRIFGHPQGQGQISTAIRRITEDAGTRRAAAVIWLPDDAIRDSVDIPCAFGLFYHRREDSLVATSVMRSNDAYTLLPFNIFEFTMLAEIIAAEVGINLGKYIHWSASLHINESLADRVQRLLQDPASPTPIMPPMPKERALESARSVARYESSIRHSTTVAQIRSHRDRAGGELDSYWMGFLDVLAIHCLRMRGENEAAMVLEGGLPEYFRHPSS